MKYKMLSKPAKFLTRTILVKNNDVDKSYNMLQRVLTNDGVVKEIRQRRFFERPCDMRSRLSFERCKRIYNGEMKRKVNFVMRKNRIDPFPR